MRISNIQNYQYQPVKPAFKEFHRSVIKPTEGLLYCNDTWFFRNTNFWDNLTDFLKVKYKNTPKVNVYNYACSDGSETLTFIMKILSENDPKLEEKFLPVIAKDIDKYVIKKAKSQEYYTIGNDEKNKIDIFTNGQYKRFFKEITQTHNSVFAYASEELYDNVNFSVADINKDYKNIKPDNSVVMVRNFWPYLKKKQSILEKLKNIILHKEQANLNKKQCRQELLEKLYSQLGKNSIIVIGDYDISGTYGKIVDEILEAGFKKTPLEYVFEKV